MTPFSLSLLHSLGQGAAATLRRSEDAAKFASEPTKVSRSGFVNRTPGVTLFSFYSFAAFPRARLRFRFGTLALLLAIGAGRGVPTAAQARADSVRVDSSRAVSLEGITVRGVRPIVSAGATSAVLVQPDSLLLTAAPTLENLLRELPFIRVRENSRGEVELSVRGSESRQVAVLVDGVPLTLGWDHRTDASVVPVTGARRVVLVRGLSSLLHGPNVLGGVVEIAVARDPFGSEAPQDLLQLRAGVDGTGARSASAVAAAPLRFGGGAGTVRGGGSVRRRPGFRLPKGLPTAAPREDDLRTNSDAEQINGFAAAELTSSAGGWLAASVSGFRAERGVPPELHVAEPRLWRVPELSRLLGVLSGGTGARPTPWGTGALQASVGVDAGHSEIDQYAKRDYSEQVNGEIADDRVLTLRLLGDHSLGRRAELRGALTLADVGHTENSGPDDALRYRQRLWSAAAEVDAPLPVRVGPVAGARISGGIALDGADTPRSGDKPPLGALSALGGRVGASAATAGGRALLHAALTRRARFPSLRELYSGALGRFVPNPDLRPEQLTAAEAGVTTRAGNLELQTVAFHHRVTDAIVRASTGDHRFRRENRDAIRSTGLELFGLWEHRGAALSGELTLQRVRVHDPHLASSSRRAEYQPAVTAGAAAKLDLPLGLRAAASTQLTGRQWCVHPDLDREIPLDSGVLHELQVSRSWSIAGAPAPLRTIVALDNVTDAAVYDQCGLPRPGRTLRFQIEIA